jgi:hypothetical protein
VPRLGDAVATDGGVGVGPWATSGPLGAALGAALADGSIEEDGPGDTGGADPDEPGTVGDPPGPVVDGLDAVGSEELLGAMTPGFGEVPPAMLRSGWVGVTNPAVSATVARMRFRSPIATTRRARWAEVTTTGGLLPTGQWRRSLRTARW